MAINTLMPISYNGGYQTNQNIVQNIVDNDISTRNTLHQIPGIYDYTYNHALIELEENFVSPSSVSVDISFEIYTNLDQIHGFLGESAGKIKVALLDSVGTDIASTEIPITSGSLVPSVSDTWYLTPSSNIDKYTAKDLTLSIKWFGGRSLGGAYGEQPNPSILYYIYRGLHINEIFGVHISGNALPEFEDMPMMIQGPCGDKGHILPSFEVFPESLDHVVTAFSSDTGWDVKSLRFSIPNFGNSFVVESGFANVGEAAFYGYADYMHLGQNIGDRVIDGLEFWTNYASGTLAISGNNPYFYEPLTFIGVDDSVISFSGGNVERAEVRIDIENEVADFRFEHFDEDANVITFEPTVSFRENFIIGTDFLDFREYAFDNVLSPTQHPFLTNIRRFCYNVINNDVIYANDNGVGRFNLSTSAQSDLIARTGITDIDICYNNNKAYYITSDAVYSCNVLSSGEVEEFALPERLSFPKLAVSTESDIVLGAVSGNVYHYTNSGTWSYSILPMAKPSGQFDVETYYFIESADDFVLGTFIANDNKLFNLRNATNFYTDNTPTEWLASGIKGMMFDEDQYLYALHGTNQLRKYNTDTRLFVSTIAPAVGNSNTVDLTFKQNKNYLNTSSATWPLLPLGKCCNAAPSGFIQLEAGYSDPSMFGYPDGDISFISPFWGAAGNDVVRIDGTRTFATVGFHDYISFNAEINSYWRNAGLNLRIHNFKNTISSPAATGTLNVYNVEYRYEDCFTATDSDELDLFIVAGFNNDNLELVTSSSVPESDSVDLFTTAAITFDTIPLYINSIADIQEDITLFLYNIPSADINLFIEGTEADEFDESIDMFTMSSANDSSYDTMSMYTMAGFGEELNLYIGAGRADDTANINLVVGGIQNDGFGTVDMTVHNVFLFDSGDVAMFTAGPTGSGYADNTLLYMAGQYPLSGPWGGEQLMVINNKDGVSNDTNMYIAGAVELSEDVALTISGRHMISENPTMYTHGF